MFHAGALGDLVMIWPLLRALECSGREVTIVASASKAALCAAELRINQVSIEQPRFLRLWQGGEGLKDSEREPGVSEVYTFLADGASEAGQRWLRGAAAMFPGARVTPVGPPGSATRAAIWRATGASGESGAPEPRENPRGPVVLHVGAGGTAKRWPLDRWHAVWTLVMARAGSASGGGGEWGQEPQVRSQAPGVTADEIRRAAQDKDRAARPDPLCIALAGEVEAEQFGAVERRLFADMDGRYVFKLGELAATLKRARLFVGADTGPSHLAAQLGVPTIALFGPTDPRVWSPASAGSWVHVLAPPEPREMEWISVGDVARVIGA